MKSFLQFWNKTKQIKNFGAPQSNRKRHSSLVYCGARLTLLYERAKFFLPTIITTCYDGAMIIKFFKVLIRNFFVLL